VAGEGHFQQREQHAAVGAVMISEDQSPILQLNYRGEQREQEIGTIEIRRLAAALRVNLSPA